MEHADLSHGGWVRIECGGLKSHDFGLLRA
jgi:hypothetical protein